MTRNKLPYFPFHVDDYLEDPAVVQMDADAEGLYVRLLCRMWKSKTPGIVFAGHVAELAGAHRLAEQYRLLWGDDVHGVDHGTLAVPEQMGRDRLKEVMSQLEVAFDTTSVPNHWVQKRMVAEHRKLSVTLDAKRRGADKTNAAKAEARSPHAKRTLSARSPAEEVDVEVEEEESKEGRASPRAASPKHVNTPLSDKFSEVREWLLSLQDEPLPLVPLVKWFIKTGVSHQAALIALLEHYRVHKPENPHAYYANGSKARESIVGAAMIAVAEAEQKRLRLVK